jgi:hypothetical protein
MNPGKLTLAAVSGYVFMSVVKRPFEPFQLQRAQLILAGALDGFQFGRPWAMLG